MEEIVLKKLADQVYHYCGLNYRDNLQNLEVKLRRRLKELQLSLWEYVRLLEEKPQEWEELIISLTINETYFYREDRQLTVFQQKVLPELMSRGNGTVTVWSAACSTGEEPYSLAMSALEQQKAWANRVRITGTDINKKVLKHAMSGTYYKRSLSFRRIPENWLATYFTDREDAYQVKPEVMKMVSFNHLNLLDAQKMQEQTNRFDVIFCRNVLIYFDEATIKKIAEYFYHALRKGGYLFLGHAETISHLDLGFETVQTNGTFYYRKE